jgi:anti-sigma28 factor (negative regulator of flagellin synthesis)
MSDIPPIDSRVNYLPPLPAKSADEPASRAMAASEDRVEISETGQILATLENPSDIRADRVAAVREAIQNGTYETSDKIEATVNRLLTILVPTA